MIENPGGMGGQRRLRSGLHSVPPQHSLQEFKTCLCVMLLGWDKKHDWASRSSYLYKPSSWGPSKLMNL